MKKGITTMQKIEKIIKVELCKELIEDLNLNENTILVARVVDGFLEIRVADEVKAQSKADAYEEGYYVGNEEGEIDGYKLGYIIGYDDGSRGNAFDDTFPLVDEDEEPCCCKCCCCAKNRNCN
jgi:hypothetical protein